MPQHIRTARPSGDIRGLTAIAESGGVLEGEIYMVSDTFGVAFQDADVGDPFCLNYHVEKVMVFKAAIAIGVGDKIYHSGVGATPVTNVWADGLYWIGICVADAAAEDDKVKIDIKGDKASLTEPL